MRNMVLIFAFVASTFAAQLTPNINGSAPRRVQTVFPRGANHTISTIGDSWPLNYSLGVYPHEFYPEVLAGYLRDLSCTVKARNFGVSGDTTLNMVNRADVLTRFDTADIGIVAGGSNDGYGTNATTLQLQALIKCFKFGAINAVTNPAALPSGKLPGVRYVVNLDDGTNGGAAAYGNLKTTLTGSATNAQTVWECRNNNAGTNGWGRVAYASTTPTHTSKIIVVGAHYMNFSSGGDTTSAQNATYLALRGAQSTAASNENIGGATVVYCNTYTFMGALITAGQETQGSFSWHYADSNTHPNKLGEQYIAQAILATIQAQSGWITALQ